MPVLPPEEPVIACNFGAIDASKRGEHMNTADTIFAAVIDIRETENGYAFQLPLNPPMLYKVSAFISNERLCCSFFTFTLTVRDELWLELSGAGAVKAYIHDNMVVSVRESGQLSRALKAEIMASVKDGLISTADIPTT